MLQQEREKTQKHTNHPIICDVHDVHGVGGRAQLSEGWSVNGGLETRNLIHRSEAAVFIISVLLLYCNWLQGSHNFCMPKWLMREDPHLPLPHANGLEQFAVCHQLMRRENSLEPLNDNIMADFMKSAFWGEKSQMQSSLPLSCKCHVSVQQ